MNADPSGVRVWGRAGPRAQARYTTAYGLGFQLFCFVLGFGFAGGLGFRSKGRPGRLHVD